MLRFFAREVLAVVVAAGYALFFSPSVANAALTSRGICGFSWPSVGHTDNSGTSASGCLEYDSSTVPFNEWRYQNEALARADYGVLKAGASTLGAGTITGSTATATFDDVLYFGAPGLEGQPGSVSVGLVFNWVMLSSVSKGTATNYGLASIETNGGGVTNRSFRSEQRTFARDIDGNVTENFAVGDAWNSNEAVGFDVPFSHRIDFVFGEPVLLRAELSVSAHQSAAELPQGLNIDRKSVV